MNVFNALLTEIKGVFGKHYLFAGCREDINTGKDVVPRTLLAADHILRHAYLSEVAFSADGNNLLAAGAAKTWTTWTVSNRALQRTVAGHNDSIYRAIYNPAGTRMATVDFSGQLFIWDQNGQPLHYRQLPVQAAFSLAYAPDRYSSLTAVDERLSRDPSWDH